MSQPIRLEDRISSVLARDPRMLDVLLATSPTFSHLRNPIMRKTMAKLATVEHAARVAGIDAQQLVARLNAALNGEDWQAAAGATSQAPAPGSTVPAVVAQATDANTVDCDVRDDLRKGQEPFQRIMGAAVRVQPGQLLKLRAIFEPAPLYAVLGKKGFVHYTEKLAEDDWVVWFWREGSGAAAAAPATAASELDLGEDVVILDVRGLEPPEPMVRTLEALAELPVGKTLVQLNVRVPQFLIPQLAERGFVHEVKEQSADLVRIFIRHAKPAN